MASVDKSFDSLREFTEFLYKASTRQVVALAKGLDIAANVIKRDAKQQIGHLQPQVGNFNAWDELAESTKIEKERLGYVFNNDYNPLFRTGYLRNSITHEVNIEKLEAVVGSKYPVAAYQEFGTRTIPPRPFIGPAMYKNLGIIGAIFAEVTIRGIAGGNIIADEIGRAVGYHQDIKI